MSPLADLLLGPTEVKRPLAVPAPFELHARCSAPLPGAPDGASPLLDLFATINRAFEEERARGYTINAHQPSESTARLDAAVRAAVAAYLAAGHTDWRGLAHFNAEHYVRHLVDENQNFEMILICWKQGQQSRVHNHANSHCWLHVLAGGVEELRFSSGSTPRESEPAVAPRLPGVIASTSPCPLLLPLGAVKVGVGGTAYINDTLGLHAVRCDGDACGADEEGAVSLHIYAPPIRRVRLFEPEQDRVTLRTPGFSTIRGLEEEAWQHASHMSASL